MLDAAWVFAFSTHSQDRCGERSLPKRHIMNPKFFLLSLLLATSGLIHAAALAKRPHNLLFIIPNKLVN